MNYIVLNITHRPYDIVHVIGRAALRIINSLWKYKANNNKKFMESNHQTLQIILKKHTSLLELHNFLVLNFTNTLII
jgi:hypothetical protein